MARSIYLIPTLGLLGLGACVDNGDSSITILRNGVPGAGCVVSADETGPYIGSGVIEGDSLVGYVFTPVVKNFSVVETDGDEAQKIALIHGATVDIKFPDAELFDAATVAQFREDGLTHFRVPYSGSIDPGSTTSMVFEIIPADLINQVGATLPTNDPFTRQILLVDVSVDGALGTNDFQSQVFEYPVEVCNGCLLIDLGSCSDISTNFVSTNLGGACNAVQDSPLDCCTGGSGAVCPAQGTMAPAAR